MEHINEYSIFDNIPVHTYDIEKLYNLLKKINRTEYQEFDVIWDSKNRIIVVQGIHTFSDSHIMAHIMLTQHQNGHIIISMKILQYQPGVVEHAELVNTKSEIPDNILQQILDSPRIFFQNIFELVS